MGSLSRDELRLKRLEMVQAAVNRLAGNSFAIKGWVLTIASAIFALASNYSAAQLVPIAFIPTILAQKATLKDRMAP